MKGLTRDKRVIIFLSLFVLFVALLPLFSVNCINGHDIKYHLLRIEALKEGILAGKPFLKVNMLYFGGRGYASSLFYPDLMLYLPAFLRCAGVSINLSFHIFAGVCILLSFASMFYSVKLILSRFMDDKNTRVLVSSAMAAFCYTLAQYHLDDIYTRAAVGEYTAMIFLPLYIYGLFDLILGSMKKPFITSIAFAGLILCHTNTTVFAVILYLLIFLYIFIRRCIRGRLRIAWFFKVVLAVGTSMLLSAFYWIPVLEQFAAADFRTDAGGFDLDYEKLMLKDVFSTKSPSLGFILFVLWIAFFVMAHYLKKDKKLLFFADVSGICAVCFTLGATGLVPWKRLSGVLSFVQFPWRLFIMATPLFCVAIALYAAIVFSSGRCAHHASFPVFTLAIVTCAMIIFAFMVIDRSEEGYYSYSNDYFSYIPYTGSVIGGEWLPVTVKDRDALIKDCDMAYLSDGRTVEVSRHANELTVVMPDRADFVDVPFIYYKGYAAVNSNGTPLVVDGSGKNGSVRIDNPQPGPIRVYYAGTMAQNISMVISVLTLAILAWVVVGRGKILSVASHPSIFILRGTTKWWIP